MEHFASTIVLVGLVIVVASLLSGALERSGLPLVAVFLALGALLGPSGLALADLGLGSPALRIVATLALALVLFSDAVTVDIGDLRTRRRLVLRVLGPGTLAPGVVIAVLAWLLLEVPPTSAAMLGAALASTDPVVLRGLLRSPALPLPAKVALRLETGMNDVVLLPVVVVAMLFALPAGEAGGGDEAMGRALLGLFVLGPALGALVGWAGISALVQVRDRIGVRRDYESLYALGLAFTAFAVAEMVGGSGFLAAFAAGLVVASQDVELCDCFLEYGEATAEMLLLFAFVAFGTGPIWSAFAVLDGATLLFAGLALLARTALLLPLLAGTGLTTRERRLVALLGPRGLSSLLFVLLPVFAGVPGAERLFAVCCLVVLQSLVVHGAGVALFLRGAAGSAATASAAAAPSPERIGVAEVVALAERGEPFVVVDARATRSHAAEPRRPKGAVRLPPDDAVAAAERLRLPKEVPLVVYCT